ncbi:hypothetical protein ACFLUJ_06825 [Chloroflexota bacterium]
MINTRFPYWVFTLVIVIVIGILILTVGGGNRTFTLREGIGHFSFKYPSRYEPEIVRTETGPLGPETYVVLFTSTTGHAIVEYHDAEILVHIGNIEARGRNSEEAAEFNISYWSRDEDFRLIERSSIEVAGIRGEQIVYSYVNEFTPHVSLGMHSVNKPAIRRGVFFDYNGQSWSISVTGHESIDDIVKKDYNHILETFKIIE